jgi:hypothetical protein
MSLNLNNCSCGCDPVVCGCECSTCATRETFRFVASLVHKEEYNLAQGIVEHYLLKCKSIPRGGAWLVYKAFRVIGTRNQKQQVLPKDIGFWLSGLIGRGVSLSDIIELYERPGWVSQFNWVIVATECRDGLEHMKVNASYRLPVHIWTVIEATWLLTDLEFMTGLEALRNLVNRNDYGFAKNMTALNLAVAAMLGFPKLEEESVAVSAPNPCDSDCVLVCGGAGGR